MGLFRSRFNRWFGGMQVDREVLEELHFHIEMRTRDNIVAGMAPETAREDALRRFGDFERIREKCCEIRGRRFMETILRYLPPGLRGILLSPAFNLASMLVLFLGISANSVVNNPFGTLLVRAMPFWGMVVVLYLIISFALTVACTNLASLAVARSTSRSETGATVNLGSR